MASPTLIPTLDHIVLLVPYSTLTDLPAWLTSALTIIPGGTHADGLTANKLIVFADGTYIELIAFIPGVDHPERRQSHRWGHKHEGQIVDWALTLLTPALTRSSSPPPLRREGSGGGAEHERERKQEEEEKDTDYGTVPSLSSSRQKPGEYPAEQVFRTILDRIRAAQKLYEYSDLVAGGRITPDGTELRWAGAEPWRVSEGGFSGAFGLDAVVGSLPFWCLDRTPRRLRVPGADAGNVTHACGATGVADVEVVVGGEEVQGLRNVYDAVLDDDKQKDGLGLGLENARDVGTCVSWEVDTPFSQSVPGKRKSRVVVRALGERQQESPGESASSSTGVYVRLSLFTAGNAQILRGEIGGGRTLEINLISTS